MGANFGKFKCLYCYLISNKVFWLKFMVIHKICQCFHRTAYIVNVTNFLLVSFSVPFHFKNTQNHALLHLKFITDTFAYRGVPNIITSRVKLFNE